MARRSGRSVTEAILVLSGSPTYLGTIDFTSASRTNGSGASVLFGNGSTALAGKVLLLQADQDVYILPVSTSTTAVTTANGIKLFAGERVQISMKDLNPQESLAEENMWLAALRVSADGNLKVWELT